MKDEEPLAIPYGSISNDNDGHGAFNLVRALRKGITYSFFEKLTDKIPFLAKEWAGFLNISTKTLERHKEEKRDFKPVQSEKIIAIYQLLNYGFEVFEDWDNFFHWMRERNIALGN